MKKSQLKEAIKAEIKSVLTEDFKDDNRGLAYIKSDGERDGFESFTQYAGKQNLKNVPDLEAYTDGFAKGVMQKGNKLVQLISRATVGGADAEPLMKMIGLKENKENLEEIAPMGPGQTTKLADLEDEDLITVSKTEFENQFDQLEGGYIEIEDFLTAVKEIVFGKIAPRGMMREEEKEEDDDAKDKKAYRGAAKVGKKKSARDKAIDAYNEIGGSEEVREKEKKKKKGDKEALNWLLSNQKVIKAYNEYIPK